MPLLVKAGQVLLVSPLQGKPRKRPCRPPPGRNSAKGDLFMFQPLASTKLSTAAIPVLPLMSGFSIRSQSGGGAQPVIVTAPATKMNVDQRINRPQLTTKITDERHPMT